MPTSYARLAGESTPGNETTTPTYSTKKTFVPADEVEISRNEQFLERDDEMRGLSEPIPIIAETYAPSWRLHSRLYPDTFGQVMADAFGIGATGETGGTHYAATAGNGVITDPDAVAIPVGVTRHVWTFPLGPSGASPKTHQLIAAYKDQGVFWEARGCATEEITIDTPEQGGAMLTARGPAAWADTTADPALTAAYEAVGVRPFMRSGLTVVTWLTGSAETSDFGITITQPVDMVRTLGGASKYPDAVEKGEGLVLVTGSIDKRFIDIDDINALEAATEFATKTRWKSDTVIASGYTYGLWIELSAAQYSEGSHDPLSNKRRHGSRFGFRAARNASASCTITLCNATASYA